MLSVGRPRLNIDITEEQEAALRKYLPPGQKGILFRCLIDDLIDMLEVDADKVLALIMCRKLRSHAILQGWEDELNNKK